MTRIVPASDSNEEGDNLTNLQEGDNTMPKANEKEPKNKNRSQADQGGGDGGNGYVGNTGTGKTGLPNEIGKTSTPGSTKADEVDDTVDSVTADALKVRPAAQAADDDSDEEDMAANSADTKNQTAKVLTAQEYIDNAPAGIKELLTQGMKAQATMKTEIIKALQATNRCHFDVKVLNAKPLEELQNLLVLAGGKMPEVGNYMGMAGPVPHSQSSGDDSLVATPPKPFARGDLATLQSRVNGRQTNAASSSAA